MPGRGLSVDAVGFVVPVGHTVMNEGSELFTEVTLTIAAVALEGTGLTPATLMSTVAP